LFINTACSTLTVDISKPIFAMVESNKICKKSAVCSITNYSTKIRQISPHKTGKNVIEQQNVIRAISDGNFTGHQLADSSIIPSKALANGWNVVGSVSFIN
jgi:hypothetical protein